MGIWNRYYPEFSNYQIIDDGKPVEKNAGNYFIRYSTFANLQKTTILLNKNDDPAFYSYTTLVYECQFRNLIHGKSPMVIIQYGGACVLYHICSYDIQVDTNTISHMRTILKFNANKKSYYLESSASQMFGFYEHQRFDGGDLKMKSVNMTDSYTKIDNAMYIMNATSPYPAETSYCSFHNCSTNGYDGFKVYEYELYIKYCSVTACTVKMLGLFGVEYNGTKIDANNVYIARCTYPYLAYMRTGTFTMRNSQIIDSSNATFSGSYAFHTINKVDLTGDFLTTYKCLGKYKDETDPIFYEHIDPNCLVFIPYISLDLL